jgi:hypothetical protein
MSESDEPSAKKQRGDDGEHEDGDSGAEQQHENDSNGDGAGGDAIDSVADNPVTASEASARVAELKRTELHFSKIASQFGFEPNTAAFMDWTVQFEAELGSHELDHVLTDDPATAEQQWSDDSPERRVARQQQKTVYGMIVRCIALPQIRTVVVTALPLDQRTGYHAWHALRRHFIGDEETYKMSLESKFEAFRWEADESWATMETRFEALLAQLAAAGVSKEPHQKRARIMHAIQHSGRHDAQGGSVFTRLHTTNRIKESLGYLAWITAMRTEAQMIQDELGAKRGAKRTRDEQSADEPTRQSVSFVGQSTQFDGPASAAPRSGETAVCRNMRDRGFCRYGKECRLATMCSPEGGPATPATISAATAATEAKEATAVTAAKVA